MRSKQPTIEDIYMADAYITTSGVRQGLLERAAEGDDDEVITEDTDDGQVVYYRTPYGEMVPVGRPVMLAAGPSETVTDAGPTVRVGRAGVQFRPPSLRDITEPVAGMADMLAATGKGLLQGFVGLPGELEALTYGITEIFKRGAGEGKLDAFLRGFQSGTVLPKTDEVKKWLDQNVGQVGAGTNPYESVGEVVAPGGQIRVAQAAGRAAATGAKALAPKAGEMAGRLLERQGLIIPAVPLERYGQVATQSAAKVRSGEVRLSSNVVPEQNLQLAPKYRVKVEGAYTPEGGGQNITNVVNPGNYIDVSTRLDNLAVAFPDPLASNESFSTMLANVYNSTEVPIPPRWMVENVNDMGKWSNWFGSMTKGQIDEAARGFAVVDKFKNVYKSGAAGADTTGTLMFWAMLSRRASAYPHESGFLDLAEAMQPIIQKAVRGEYSQADIDAGLQMIKQTIPAGSPGKMVTSNANDFLSVFLPKMSEKLPDGRTKLQALHDMVANPEMTGPQIRREFFGLAENVGIKNKVLSFALLVSGRDDVMVLDRIQINRLFAGGDKIYDDVAHLFDGGPGLAIYEGLERSLAPKVKELYTRVGRPDQSSIGRYHWESWVLSSGQEVAHPTLETIVKKAEGVDQPFSNVPVKEGRMHERAFGVTYERTPEGGNRFVYPMADGQQIAMTKNDLDELFNHVMDKKSGIIPDNFPGVKFFSKDTLPDGSPNQYFGKPWYTWPGVNRELIDDFAAAIGAPIESARSAGAVPRAGKSNPADRPQRTTGGQAGTRQQPGVMQGGQALQKGAK
jgi:hypothetical protein